MSTGNIEQLIRRTKAAESTKQKNIVISIKEANDLITEIAMLSSNATVALDNIARLLTKMQETQTIQEVKVDGGHFKE